MSYVLWTLLQKDLATLESLLCSPKILLENANLPLSHGFVPFSWEVSDDQVSGDIIRDSEIAGNTMAAYQKA